MLTETQIALTSAAFSALAVTVSVIALFVAERQQKLQAKHEANLYNVASLTELWGKIEMKPALLRFHGVSKEELDAYSLDAADLAYLVASFEAANYYYEEIDQTTGVFPETSLRYQMCAPEATRKAWPLIRRFFIGSPKYLARIEATVEHHNRKERAPVA